MATLRKHIKKGTLETVDGKIDVSDLYWFCEEQWERGRVLMRPPYIILARIEDGFYEQ